jgi:hypothetical protein
MGFPPTMGKAANPPHLIALTSAETVTVQPDFVLSAPKCQEFDKDEELSHQKQQRRTIIGNNVQPDQPDQAQSKHKRDTVCHDPS